MSEKKDSKFDTSQLISMFPTFVWQTALKQEVYQPIDASIIKKLDEMRRSAADNRPGLGWQSDQSLHELAEFQGLVACIFAAVNAVLEFLKIGHDGFEITGCWANVNARGVRHRAHSHPNNYLSGVYYVQVPDEANTINFHDPRVQMYLIRPPVRELTRENTDQVVVSVQEGMLLLFPSWLQHSVDPNPCDEKRISISFNVMFSSYVENMSKPLW